MKSRELFQSYRVFISLGIFILAVITFGFNASSIGITMMLCGIAISVLFVVFDWKVFNKKISNVKDLVVNIEHKSLTQSIVYYIANGLIVTGMFINILSYTFFLI